MAGFDKEQLQQLDELLTRRLGQQRVAILGEVDQKFEQRDERLDQKLEQQRAAIMVDTRILLQQELRPIREDIAWIKAELERLSKRTDEDDRLALREIEALKKKVRILETRLVALER